ncbi:MAG TPA: hypothetical protein VGL16_06255 [Actinomycetota bacterium]
MIAEITPGAVFLGVLAIALIGSGVFRVAAPARALRWDYRWDERRTRWFTFGKIRSVGPIMSDQTGHRVVFVVGIVMIIVGVALLVGVVTFVAA